MRRPRVVIAIWVVALIGAGVAYPVLQSRLGALTYVIDGSESQHAESAAAAAFPGVGDEQAVVVLRARSGRVDTAAARASVATCLQAVRNTAGVAQVGSPFDPGSSRLLAADRRVALAPVSFVGSVADRAKLGRDVQSVLDGRCSDARLEALLTGPSALNNALSDVELADQSTAEAIGLPAAAIILVIALGALVAACLPLVTAVVGLLVAMALLTLVSAWYPLDQFVTVVASMVGLGVGIDYALFLVSRFAEELEGDDGRDAPGAARRVAPAVVTSMTTSGRTVLISGIVVMVALCSMLLIRGHVFAEIAIGAACAVTGALLVNLTLLPALLAVVGPRVLGGRFDRLLRRWRAPTPGGGLWHRWAMLVMRRPAAFAVPSVLVLLVLAAPLLSIRLGFTLGTTALQDTPAGRGQTIVTQNFGAGVVGPVQVVVRTPGPRLTARNVTAVAQLADRLRADPRVAEVVTPTDVFAGAPVTDRVVNAMLADRGVAARMSDAVAVRPDGSTVLLSVVGRDQVDSTRAMDLVEDIRHTIAPQALGGSGGIAQVGGLTAQWVDLSTETRQRLPLVIGVVLALSFVYLTIVFRSLLLPVKAIVMNALATAAALGATVWIFQQGHGDGLLRFTSAGTIQAYLPVALFSLLFGLSMDYEVFLVERIREEWQGGADDRGAVAVALERTATQITAAAMIMVVVFGAFVTSRVLELKQLGFSLAFAIAIDATIVRITLVPALMVVAGRWNWWFPFASRAARRREGDRPG